MEPRSLSPTMSRSLLKRELFSHCNSESLSEDGLRDIIERHIGLTPNNLSSFHLGNYKFFHNACFNERVTEEIIQYLLECFPSAISATAQHGWSPLHYACSNKNMTVNIIQLLIDAAPVTVRSADEDGYMPLHYLCENLHIDDAAALAILKLLILKCPEAIRHANNDGGLPINCAGRGGKSPEFCRMLIESYPGSQRISKANGVLPFHCACFHNTVATVEYLYKLHPDAIHHATIKGLYPIHYAITGVKQRVHPIAALEVVKYLLDCDPNVKLQKIRGKSLLHYACRKTYNDSNIDAALEIIEAIYDTHPEAIEENRIASDIQRYHQQVQTFINSQLVYSRQAKEHHQMTTPDSNGQLPLHTALQSNARLGSIKLLVKGNPVALQTPDNSGTLPLHVACQLHDSASVIQYLVGLDATTLDAVDHEGNTALHLACHYARHEIIALLLDKFDAVSVSKRNAQKKLPIDLLWESSAVEVEDKDSVEYTESVFRLLAAYPETLMNIGIQKPLSAFNACPGQSGRKRKFGEE
eukprot:scaffold2911_cov73-Skeletonema_marinoi.AAC.7